MRSPTPPRRPGSGGSVGALRRASSRDGRQQVTSRNGGYVSASPEESPRLVEEEQGSTWTPGPLIREEASDGPEAYAMFQPGEVLSGANSAKLRRLEADVAALRLDDVYGALAAPWAVTRRDVNEQHGSIWPEGAAADYWVSTDTGKVCVAAVDPSSSSTAPVEGGQYHKEVGDDWRRFAAADAHAPGNVGGFHCCCVDTAQPDSSWSLVAKLADFGLALGRDAGARVEFTALVRNDCEAILASFGSHDECRSLFLVEEVRLKSGRVLLVDPAEVRGSNATASDVEGDGPAVASGLGAGYYPVVLSRDESNLVCRITVVFHPSRLDKVCRRFPPLPSPVCAAQAPDKDLLQ